MKVNEHMMALLEHEKRCLDAEEQGLQPPEAPPMPNFKPCFDKGLWFSGRELVAATIKKIYEFVTIRRVGVLRAESLTRDSKVWIRDVLAVKHR